MSESPTWDRVKAVFQQAVDLPEAERAPWLDRECAGDAELRTEVMALLAAHDEAGGPLSTTAFSLTAPRPDGGGPFDDEMEGQRVGPYRVVQRIAAGGMGTVYRAVRADAAFEKQVAIKVIKRGMDTEETLRRFQDERQTLARLDHPNIAKLLDGGSTADARPYLVMDYVEGRRIDDYCDDATLSIEERLRLFMRVCRAVEHAHHNLVIHRDLKPDNILVTADGEPKLVDFGIAKMLAGPIGGAGAGGDALTSLVDRRMTLAYSSPEQVRGEPMTTASDVYALGVILYELLTGRRPYRRIIATPIGYERALEDVVAPPSVRVRETQTRTVGEIDAEEEAGIETIAAARQTSVQALARSLNGDLDAIVLKAIQPDVTRRYSSAQQLADDLDRYLAGMPVLARADSAAYRARKFVRRHRAGVAALVVVVLALAFGLAGTLWQARVAAGERDRAGLEARKARQITSFLLDMLGSADPSTRGRDVTVVEVLGDAQKRADQELANQPEELSLMRATIGSTYLRLGRTEQAIPLFRQALATREARLGPNHPEVAETLQELGSALAETGDVNGAEPLFQRALEIRKRTSGEESGETAKVLDSLGSLHSQKGELPQAIEIHRQALAMRRKVLGNDHPDLVHSLNNLAVPLGTLGRWKEALPLHQEALALVLRTRGPEHRDTAAAMTTLAYALESNDQFREADTYYARALALRRKILGPEHPEAAWTAYNYASMLQFRGQCPRAVPMLNEVLALRGKTLPEGHPMVAASLMTRGICLASAGHAEAAEKDMRDSLDVRIRTLPPDHWLIASSRSVLGEQLTRRRQFAEAEPLLVAGYDGLLKRFGAADSRTRTALTRIVALYDGWGHKAEAATWRQKGG